MTKKGEKFLEIKIKKFATLRKVAQYNVKSRDELPEEHRSVNLISDILSPDWILYLFDIDFNLNKMERKSLGEKAEKYGALYNEILIRYKANKN